MDMHGFCFEDSVFSEPRDRSAGSGAHYIARHCEPQWFSEDLNSEDTVEVITALKFRADAAYRQTDFKKALGDYSSCFLLLPPSNTAMRRDVQESQARCLLHLGRYSEALDLAKILRQGTFNTDQLTSALNLQITIYSHLQDLQEATSCSQQLITLHPFNPWMWKRLAEFYMRLFLTASDYKSTPEYHNGFDLFMENSLINEPTSSPAERRDRGEQLGLNHSVSSKDISNCNDQTTPEGPINQTAVDSGKCSLLKLCTKTELLMYSCASYIRARLLFQIVQSQQASFVLENNLKAQEQIEEQLNIFRLKEDTRTLMNEMMGEDLSAERIREEGQIDTKSTLALTSFTMPSDEEFRDKWFKKISSFLADLI
ncbi:uncharacterized protein C8orf76-like [Rhinophrynus dorsalis]